MKFFYILFLWSFLPHCFAQDKNSTKQIKTVIYYKDKQKKERCIYLYDLKGRNIRMEIYEKGKIFVYCFDTMGYEVSFKKFLEYNYAPGLAHAELQDEDTIYYDKYKRFIGNKMVTRVCDNYDPDDKIVFSKINVQSNKMTYKGDDPIYPVFHYNYTIYNGDTASERFVYKTYNPDKTFSTWKLISITYVRAKNNVLVRRDTSFVEKRRYYYKDGERGYFFTYKLPGGSEGVEFQKRITYKKNGKCVLSLNDSGKWVTEKSCDCSEFENIFKNSPTENDLPKIIDEVKRDYRFYPEYEYY